MTSWDETALIRMYTAIPPQQPPPLHWESNDASHSDNFPNQSSLPFLGSWSPAPPNKRPPPSAPMTTDSTGVRLLSLFLTEFQRSVSDYACCTEFTQSTLFQSCWCHRWCQDLKLVKVRGWDACHLGSENIHCPDSLEGLVPPQY